MPFTVEPDGYNVWKSMRRRCDNPNAKQYYDYGGRGISYCDEWREFKTFIKDMGPRPPGTSLDRIDNDKGYSPANCRWATRKEQQRNQRRTVFLDFEGKRYRAAELAELSGLKWDTIIARAKQGLAYEEVISPTRRTFTGGVQKAWRNSVAVRAARTHCKNGHEWTVENTRITPQGWKNCRACDREKMRRRNAARRSSAED